MEEQLLSEYSKEEMVALLKREVPKWNRLKYKNIKFKADLKGANLTGVNLKKANLWGADLAGADLSEADLTGADLWGADLTGADLSGSDLSETFLSYAKIDSQTKLDKKWYLVWGIFNKRRKGQCLSGADLSGADLGGTYLVDANLTGANLSRVNLRRADLTGANLRGANLREAKLTEADLSGSDLSGANLTEAWLGGTNLKRANLSEANLKNIQVADYKGRTETDFTNAIFQNTRFTLEKEDNALQEFLELSTAETLPKACFKDPSDFTDYISRAFQFVHREETPVKTKFPNLVTTVIKRINSLLHLFQATEPSSLAIEEIKRVTSEVVEYLKRHPEKIYNIGNRQFEELVADILASFGWDVQLTQLTRDGGYDIFGISKDVAGVETSWLIECKRYRKDRPVGIEIARALYGVKTKVDVANMMLATTSYFTKGVKEFKASRYDLALRDYEGILEWINQYQPHPDGQWYVDGKSGLVLPK